LSDAVHTTYKKHLIHVFKHDLSLLSIVTEFYYTFKYSRHKTQALSLKNNMLTDTEH